MLRPLTFAVSILAAAAFVSISRGDDAAKPGEYTVADTWKLGGEGRWDYVSLDPSGEKLYVTRSTHTLVVDTQTGKAVGDIKGGKGLHGVAIDAKAKRGFISDGRGAGIIVFDTKTNEVLGTVDAAEDADGIVYDSATDKVLCVCGDPGLLVVLDPNADPKTAKVDKVELGGKPEAFDVDGAGKAFININDKNEIAVVDIKGMNVTDRWKSGTGTEPTGMAVDVKNKVLFSGCRNEKIVVISLTDGKVLGELPIGKGNDDCAFDAGTSEAFASCGDGTTTVVAADRSGTYAVKQIIKTAQGARTMTVDAKSHTLYLPTADFDAAQPGQRRPPMKPDTFKIVVVKRR